MGCRWAGFDDFVREVRPPLLRALTRLAGDPTVAEDVVQDALVYVVHHWDRVSRADSPVAYTWKVALGRLDKLRRRQGVERRHLPSLVSPSTMDLADEASRGQVWDLVWALPEKQRLAVVLREVVGLPYADIADQMGVSQDLARQLRSRGMRFLRRNLPAEVDNG